MSLMIGSDVKPTDGLKTYIEAGNWYEFMPHFFPVYDHQRMRLKVIIDKASVKRVTSQ